MMKEYQVRYLKKKRIKVKQKNTVLVPVLSHTTSFHLRVVESKDEAANELRKHRHP